MGYGSYSYEAHQAITTARSALPAQQVFTQRSCHPLMNPFGVKLRECRDSPDHPNSLGIVFALDVSGSMGTIPEIIARKELPGFMKTLGDCKVADPQILFMAFSDVDSNVAPLQVGQFESTAELMDQWLTWCWLEGGGRTPYESYDLALYFAAKHTAMDCWDKRRHKGYLFMSGDEPSYDALSAAWVKQVVGDDLKENVPLARVVADVERTFHPFFLIPDPGRASVAPFWQKVLGRRTIVMEGPEDTCAVAAGIVAITEKAVPSLAALGKLLRDRGTSEERTHAVLRALAPYAESIGIR